MRQQGLTITHIYMHINGHGQMKHTPRTHAHAGLYKGTMQGEIEVRLTYKQAFSHEEVKRGAHTISTQTWKGTHAAHVLYSWRQREELHTQIAFLCVFQGKCEKFHNHNNIKQFDNYYFNQ